MQPQNNIRSQIILDKKNWAFIFCIWLIAQLFFLRLLGINDKQEAETYIGITNEIVAGKWKQPVNFWMYSGYIAIHLFIHLIGLSYKWVYLIQLLISALALFAATKLLSLWLSSKTALFITTTLYSTCPFIQSWVSFLYTDSVFASLLTIAIFFLFCQNDKQKFKIGLWASILLLPFFRPIGFLFTILSIFYWIVDSPKKNVTGIIFSICYFLFAMCCIEYIFNNSPLFFYPYHNAEANIICGLPNDLVHEIKVPYHLGMSMLSFFTSNPKMTFYLFSQRLFRSLWITRPFFSRLHNLLIITLLIPYYFFALTGLCVIIYNRIKKLYFIIIGILLFIAPSVLLCADWLTRFSLPVFPFIFLLIGFGVEFYIAKKWKILPHNFKKCK